MVSGVLDDVRIPDVAYFNKEGDTAGAGESRRNSRRASTGDQPIDDFNDEGLDEDFGMMSDGDVSVCSSSEESEDETVQGVALEACFLLVPLLGCMPFLWMVVVLL